MSNITVIFPGTFDPITNGHLDIVKRANNLFDKVIVVVAKQTTKDTMFTFEERLRITKESIDRCQELSCVDVEGINGLLVDFADSHNANVIIRGLRAVSDFEYELQMAFMNRSLNKKIEIIYMMPYIRHSFLSSSIIKNVFLSGGSIDRFVPKVVIRYMEEKVKKGGLWKN